MSDRTVYEVHGHYDDAYLVTLSGKIVGCFYAEPGEPGWWRGHVNGRGVREIYVPGDDVDPLEVAARFMPGRFRRAPVSPSAPPEG